MVYKISLFKMLSKVSAEFSECQIEDGHAGKTETEWEMASRPELVHMDAEKPEDAVKHHRLRGLKGINTPISWYANHPAHQESSAVDAKREIVVLKYEKAAEYVADSVKRIKKDEEALDILAEYFDAW